MKLHLHVKSVYFDQIAGGWKREEFRLHNAYWVKRLVDMPSGAKRSFESIVIHRGYKPGPENRLEFPWQGWRLTGITHPHFGPDEVTVFAINISNPDKPERCKPITDAERHYIKLAHGLGYRFGGVIPKGLGSSAFFHHGTLPAITTHRVPRRHLRKWVSRKLAAKERPPT
jgi:hypothetical protein